MFWLKSLFKVKFLKEFCVIKLCLFYWLTLYTGYLTSLPPFFFYLSWAWSLSGSYSRARYSSIATAVCASTIWTSYSASLPVGYVSHRHLVEIGASYRLLYLRNLNHFIAFVAHLTFFVNSELFELCLLIAKRTDTLYLRGLIHDCHSWLNVSMLCAAHWSWVQRALLKTLCLSCLLVYASIAKLIEIIDSHKITRATFWLASKTVLSIVYIYFLSTFSTKFFFFLNVFLFFAS